MNTKVENTNEVSDVDILQELIDRKMNTSQIIRYFGSIWPDPTGKLESDRSRIVKVLRDGGINTKNGGEIKYQQVRNIMITPVNKK